jgi:hypothetical protein
MVSNFWGDLQYVSCRIKALSGSHQQVLKREENKSWRWNEVLPVGGTQRAVDGDPTVAMP